MIEVVLLQIVIGNDIVIHKRVSLGPEVPGLVLGVVRASFQTRQLVLKINNVVGLFISQSSVFIFCKSIYEIFIFRFFCCSFNLLVCVLLRDGVVLRLRLFVLSLLHVGRRLDLSLELFLCLLIGAQVLLPRVIVVALGKEHFVGLGHRYFLDLSHF